VHRERRGYADLRRSFTVNVDGEPTATVRRGDAVTIPVSSGAHRVRLTIDWCRSPDLDVYVAAGEELRIRCWSRANPLFALYWITLGRHRYIGAELEQPSAAR
jgi:hypothetical protein